jgi:hypothetical protein
VPEIRSDFSRSKKAAAKKSNSNDDVGGAFKMFVGVAVLRSQAMAQAEGQVRSRPWLVFAFLVVLCELSVVRLRSASLPPPPPPPLGGQQQTRPLIPIASECAD